MNNHLEIETKNKQGQLEVLVNIPNNTIKFDKETIKMSSKVFSCPTYLNSNEKWEISFTYGMGGQERRERDIKKIKKLQGISVQERGDYIEDPPACFLHLHFPEQTKINLTNY